MNIIMEQEFTQRFVELEKKINAIYVSVEKTRKYFLWTMWATVVMFVLPLVALAFVIPMFLGSYVGSFEGLI